MTFGEKIVYLRKLKGLSQDQLAEQLGVTRQSISKWERDEVIADTDRVLALSKLFGVSCDYLLDDSITDASYGRSGFDAAFQDPQGSSNTATVPPLGKSSSFDKVIRFCKRNWYWLGLIPLLWGLGDLLALYYFMMAYVPFGSLQSFLHLFSTLFRVFPYNGILLIVFVSVFLFAAAKIGLGLFLMIWGRKHRIKKERASQTAAQDAE